jgi:hypothetical protein
MIFSQHPAYTRARIDHSGYLYPWLGKISRWEGRPKCQARALNRNKIVIASRNDDSCFIA